MNEPKLAGMTLHLFMSLYALATLALFVVGFFWPMMWIGFVVGSAYVGLWFSDGWRPWVLK